MNFISISAIYHIILLNLLMIVPYNFCICSCMIIDCIIVNSLIILADAPTIIELSIRHRHNLQNLTKNA